MINSIFSPFTHIDIVYSRCLLILSIGLIINALEDIKTWNIFKSSGLLSWEISKFGFGRSSKDLFVRVLDFFLNDTFFKCSIYLRILLSCLLLIFCYFNIISSLLLITLFFLNSLVCLRSNYSLDGAYQMSLVILFSLSIGSLFGVRSQASQICLWFITCQLALSYIIAGITKICSPVWRNQHAIRMIFSTKVYGNNFIYALVNKSKISSFLITWSVLIFETSYFIVFLHPASTILFIFIGVAFHFANALFMGLNNFLFAFAAAYPCLLYCVSTYLNIRDR